jgi:hypothetical protein
VSLHIRAQGTRGGRNWEVIKTGYGANKECGREGGDTQVGGIFWDTRHHGLRVCKALRVRCKLLGEEGHSILVDFLFG